MRFIIFAFSRLLELAYLLKRRKVADLRFPPFIDLMANYLSVSSLFFCANEELQRRRIKSSTYLSSKFRSLTLISYCTAYMGREFDGNRKVGRGAPTAPRCPMKIRLL